MPVVTTAEYVVMVPRIRQGPALYRPDPDTIVPVFHVRIWPDPACAARGSFSAYPMLREGKFTMLVKVFPIKLQNGLQDKVEAVVREFAPKGPGAEDGTLSFRVYWERYSEPHVIEKKKRPRAASKASW